MQGDILIIGNGFDLYHKLPTRYDDFMFLASEWKAFYDEYSPEVKESEEKQILVPLSDEGRLTQEALLEFGRYGYLMNRDHIAFLNQTLKQNTWIQYFTDLKKDGLRWLDFETEIQNALYDTEEYCMEVIPKFVGRKVADDIPERLARVANIFGSAARNDYLNFGIGVVSEKYIDISKLQNNKIRLIEFMLNELDNLITCLDYYLDDFVSLIKCNTYSEQIRNLGEVSVLNFNYTQTFRTVYGKNNLHEHHDVHGGIMNQDIVLGISDDAFPDNLDYIRFQKFFQRIQKRTGSSYKKWLDYTINESGVSSTRDVYIMGHSLGIADYGVLRNYFENECIGKTIIFYHCQAAYEELVINLVKAFGREKVVEQIGTGRIEFRKLKPPVDIKE